MLHYCVRPDPHSHLYHVSLSLTAESDSVTLSMASWTTGSYLIRDYVGRIRAPKSNSGILRQTAKNRWQISGLTPGETLVVEWSAFAMSLGIHDAWLSIDRGFINPAAVFLFPEANGLQPLFVQFDSHDFRAISSLPEQNGKFVAASLDELLDSPFTLFTTSKHSSQHEARFDCCGISFRIAVSGTASLNLTRIVADTKKIITETHRFWGSAPFSQYVVHIHCGPALFGGLEHQTSCVLLKDAAALPAEHETEMPKDYNDFLRLLAHEYFHAWLVKFLRPSALLPYRLDQEVHTQDLWVFEGFTSYYENIIPLRAGLLTDESFLRCMSERFRAVREREGFRVEPLADASFNAWTQLYKPTADSAYSQSSYYGKGAILAFIADMMIRTMTSNRLGLESVLRAWYEAALIDPSRRALPETGFPALAESVTGLALTEALASLTQNANAAEWDTHFTQALITASLTEKLWPDEAASIRYAGLYVTNDNNAVRVRYTPTDGAAFAAGLFAGDEIAAIDGIRTKYTGYERQIEAARGRTVNVAFFRNDRLFTTQLSVPDSPRRTPGILVSDSNACEAPLEAFFAPGQNVQSIGAHPCAESQRFASLK